MDKTNERLTSGYLRNLINSDLELARVYLLVARSAYQRFEFDEGDFARSKAVAFYHEALHCVLQLGSLEREAFVDALQTLRTRIERLLMKSDTAEDPSPFVLEEISIGDIEEITKEAKGCG